MMGFVIFFILSSFSFLSDACTLERGGNVSAWAADNQKVTKQLNPCPIILGQNPPQKNPDPILKKKLITAFNYLDLMDKGEKEEANKINPDPDIVKSLVDKNKKSALHTFLKQAKKYEEFYDHYRDNIISQYLKKSMTLEGKCKPKIIMKQIGSSPANPGGARDGYSIHGLIGYKNSNNTRGPVESFVNASEQSPGGKMYCSKGKSHLNPIKNKIYENLNRKEFFNRSVPISCPRNENGTIKKDKVPIIVRPKGNYATPEGSCAGSFAKFFKDNVYEIKNGDSIKKDKNYKSFISCVKGKLSKGKKISNIIIESSSSRLNNTNDNALAKDSYGQKGFLGLSKARAESMKEFLESITGENGEASFESSKINMNYFGENGDGSSGLCPYFKYTNDENEKEKIFPHYDKNGEKRAELDASKYVRVTIIFLSTNETQNHTTSTKKPCHKTFLLGCHKLVMKCEGEEGWGTMKSLLMTPLNQDS